MSRPVNAVTGAQEVQLPLGIQLRDNARFDNFLAGPNHQLLEVLDRCVVGQESGPVFIWGGAGHGKTHLLQAVCNIAALDGKAVAYVPLDKCEEISSELLMGLEKQDIVCIDNVDAIAGRSQWEEALFHLFNRVREQGSILIASAKSVPANIGLRLPDLVSRLLWGLTLSLKALDDEGMMSALQLRARGRGLELPDETGKYLLSRYPRDLRSLCAILDQLDHASLVEQRKLTIPFVKSALLK